jgi:hypothetical protein
MDPQRVAECKRAIRKHSFRLSRKIARKKPFPRVLTGSFQSAHPPCRMPYENTFVEYLQVLRTSSLYLLLSGVRIKSKLVLNALLAHCAGIRRVSQRCILWKSCTLLFPFLSSPRHVLRVIPKVPLSTSEPEARELRKTARLGHVVQLLIVRGKRTLQSTNLFFSFPRGEGMEQEDHDLGYTH